MLLDESSEDGDERSGGSPVERVPLDRLLARALITGLS
jgi:hypothetical protein